MEADGLPEAAREAVGSNDGELLMAAIRELEELPQVRVVPSSIFDRAKPPGSVAQQRGVVVKLRCCKKSIDQKCNDLEGDAACPTAIEAARFLRLKVLKKHGSIECFEKAKEALAEEESSNKPLAPKNALSLMMEKELAVQRAQKALKLAEKRSAEASQQLAEVKISYPPPNSNPYERERCT